MKNYSLVSLEDHVLMRGLKELCSRDRVTTAEVLAHIAEVDRRRLYAEYGCPSMVDYCVRHLRMSEDVAAKRRCVARVARRQPWVFEAIAEGRLHLSGILLVRPHLVPANEEELLRAIVDKSKAEVAALIAGRFPQADAPTVLRPIRVTSVSSKMDPDPFSDEGGTSMLALNDGCESSARASERAQSVDDSGDAAVPAEAAAPATTRFALQLTIDQETHDLLREAQDLLSHALPTRDVPEVLKRALSALVTQLRKRRYGATDSPRRPRGSKNDRYIPVAVRRAVWKRDGGRCTFVSANGERCPSTSLLQPDHVVTFARGGRSTVENLRLRCAAHNQYAAERLFGAGFMQAKREEAMARREVERASRERHREAERAARAQARANAHAAREREREAERAAKEQARAEALAAREREKAELAARRQADAAKRALIEEVVPALQNLGYPLARARVAAATTEPILDAPIKDRILLALKSLTPPCRRYAPGGVPVV